MDNLFFCLNATVPIFLLVLLGMFFRRVGLFDEAFSKKLNKFVFTAALPVLLFHDLSDVALDEVWDPRFVLFCFIVTGVSIGISWCLSLPIRNSPDRAEFIQASYRSSATILGVSLIQNIYGNVGMAPLMIVASVPFYNVAAVLLLTLMKPEPVKLDRRLALKTLKDVATNPIILGIAAGILWASIGIPLPTVFQTTVGNVAALGTPLGLMVMGASFDGKKTLKKWKPALSASFVKLVLLTALFLPIAIWLGFSDSKLVAILVMLGSSTTVSSFIMARSMGHEGTLTSGAVMLTTFFSAFTLTAWLFLLKCLALI